MSERGSATVVTTLLIAGCITGGVVAADVAMVLGARVRAQAAADAAALAAAGEPSAPRSAAGRFARLNGATVVACSCPPGSPSIQGTVRVEVRIPVDPLLLPIATVGAEASAEREPVP